mmetsp:Transcript_34013/g.107276  ORF Transcript_34013/g.107276 Transcript_34013/m.107276 type:complete len:248 (-) Transcript_34013:968-1711(-)
MGRGTEGSPLRGECSSCRGDPDGGMPEAGSAFPEVSASLPCASSISLCALCSAAFIRITSMILNAGLAAPPSDSRFWLKAIDEARRNFSANDDFTVADVFLARMAWGLVAVRASFEICAAARSLALICLSSLSLARSEARLSICLCSLSACSRSLAISAAVFCKKATSSSLNAPISSTCCVFFTLRILPVNLSTRLSVITFSTLFFLFTIWHTAMTRPRLSAMGTARMLRVRKPVFLSTARLNLGSA